MRVVYCGQLDYWLNAPDHLGIKQGMSEMGWDWHVVDPCMGTPPAAHINNIKPDLVIHGNTDSFGQRIFENIDKDIKQVFWMLDYRTPEMLKPGEWDQWTRSASYIDAVFISAKGHMKMWEEEFGIPVFFAPHACWVPPKLGYDADFDHDVLFIGGHHDSGPLEERTKLILGIQYHLIKHDIKIKQVNATDWAQRNKVWTDMPKYYHSSKVVLDISHFWDNPGYCSGRYWYTATLGACAVTKSFPDCEEFFPHGLKWYFNTPEEAVELITTLLKDDELRLETKMKVLDWAWKHHTYKQRFEQMLKSLMEMEVLR